MIKKIVTLVSSSILIWNISLAQNPDIIWSKTYGGSDLDQARCIRETNDGGIIVGGYTASDDGDVVGYHGGYGDCWIVKLNSAGDIEWKKTFGGSKTDGFGSIIQTSDGGYIFSASTQSDDGDVYGNHGYFDAWIVKLDSIGIIQWQKCYGGTKIDDANEIIQLNKGYIFCGYTESIDGDVSMNHGGRDIWIVSLDDNGDINWEKTYGGSYYDEGVAIEKTADGGFIIGADTNSDDFNVENNNFHGATDYWILKIDSVGFMEWSGCFGGFSTDVLQSVLLTNDGGFILGGYTASNDGDVNGNHGSWDYWIVKIDSSGKLQWQNSLGGTEDDRAYSAIVNQDKSIFVAGSAISDDGDVTYNHGIYNDAWIAKLDSMGQLQWQTSYGGSNPDIANTVIQLKDGSYVFGGQSSSIDYDLPSFNQGYADLWICKLSGATAIENIEHESSFIVYPNPASSIINFHNNTDSHGNFELKDELGRCFYSGTFKANESVIINTSLYHRGIYFLNIETNDSIRIGKLILQ